MRAMIRPLYVILLPHTKSAWAICRKNNCFFFNKNTKSGVVLGVTDNNKIAVFFYGDPQRRLKDESWAQKRNKPELNKADKKGWKNKLERYIEAEQGNIIWMS
jgi:hypothetical protein